MPAPGPALHTWLTFLRPKEPVQSGALKNFFHDFILIGTISVCPVNTCVSSNQTIYLHLLFNK